MSISNCRSASELLAAHGALNSMSIKELLGALVFLLTRGLAEDDPMSLADVCEKIEELKASTVDLAGLSIKEKYMATLAAMPDDWWMKNLTEGSLTVSELRGYLCCLRCMNEDQMMGIIIYLLCKFSTENDFIPDPQV